MKLSPKLANYNSRVRILISAGEASGEMYGAQLIEALRREYALCQRGDCLDSDPESTSPPSRQKREKGGATCSDGAPQLEFFGVGGEKMRAAGCDIVVDARDLAVVGITEIISHLPKIWRRFHKLLAEADRRRPDLAVVIDSPAFNWRVARQMKKRGVPVVYYVCPQFWAWRQGRVRLLRKYVDRGLVIFPFEEKFYKDRGVSAEFVGHPLANLPKPTISREEYAARYQLDPAKNWITLMPGSRKKEVMMNLPGMLAAARLLGAEYEFVLPIAATLSQSFVAGLMSEWEGKAFSRATTPSSTDNGTAESRTLPNPSNTVYLVREALPALAHSRAGIIASGTATVEAALMETPFVMVYRVNWSTYLLGRLRVKVSHFAMVNLIAGKEVVPEFVQQDFTAQTVVAAVSKIIPDGREREAMLDGLRRVKDLLRGHGRGDGHPPEKAARAALVLAGTHRQDSTG